MSKTNRRMATKAERMAEKKAEKQKKKKERINFLKIVGVSLCITAVMIFAGTLYITRDYREQKAVLNDYLTAVRNGNYEDVMECYYPEYSEKFSEYSGNDSFAEKYMQYKTGHLKSLYGDDYKIKFKVVSRFDYTDLMRSDEKHDNEAVLFDARVTYYNASNSTRDSVIFIFIKVDGKWYLYDSGIEVVTNSEEQLIKYCTE